MSAAHPLTSKSGAAPCPRRSRGSLANVGRNLPRRGTTSRTNGRGTRDTRSGQGDFLRRRASWTLARYRRQGHARATIRGSYVNVRKVNGVNVAQRAVGVGGRPATSEYVIGTMNSGPERTSLPWRSNRRNGTHSCLAKGPIRVSSHALHLIIAGSALAVPTAKSFRQALPIPLVEALDVG